MADDDDPRIEANRRRWDERVPLHVASDFYDVEGFRQEGVLSLRDFEIEELGSVEGRELAHLQCHFGQDTLSWARLGASVMGLDFSKPAVEAANALAAELALDARFVHANVYDAVEALGKPFDIVYTGLGAINWLPDLARWAGVIDQLLRPGGTFYLAEFHPLIETLGDDDLTISYPYFMGPEGISWDDTGTYTDRSAVTEHNEGWEWTHPLSEVATVLLGRGFHLELFHEFPYTLFPRWTFLEEREPGRYHLPAGMPSIPMMYTMRWSKASV
jgi:SAM-dependent methyltransferase